MNKLNDVVDKVKWVRSFLTEYIRNTASIFDSQLSIEIVPYVFARALSGHWRTCIH